MQEEVQNNEQNPDEKPKIVSDYLKEFVPTPEEAVVIEDESTRQLASKFAASRVKVVSDGLTENTLVFDQHATPMGAVREIRLSAHADVPYVTVQLAIAEPQVNVSGYVTEVVLEDAQVREVVENEGITSDTKIKMLAMHALRRGRALNAVHSLHAENVLELANKSEAQAKRLADLEGLLLTATLDLKFEGNDNPTAEDRIARLRQELDATQATKVKAIEQMQDLLRRDQARIGRADSVINQLTPDDPFGRYGMLTDAAGNPTILPVDGDGNQAGPLATLSDENTDTSFTVNPPDGAVIGLEVVRDYQREQAEKLGIPENVAPDTTTPHERTGIFDLSPEAEAALPSLPGYETIGIAPLRESVQELTDEQLREIAADPTATVQDVYVGGEFSHKEIDRTPRIEAETPDDGLPEVFPPADTESSALADAFFDAVNGGPEDEQ